jgi:hypothetical protein
MESRTLLVGCLAVALLLAAVVIALPPAPVPAPAGPASPAPSLRPDTPGTLTITSHPSGAAIWIDTDPGPSTTTPATLTLSPITHPVLLRHPGYRDYETSVEVRPGATISLAVEMEPGN